MTLAADAHLAGKLRHAEPTEHREFFLYRFQSEPEG